MTKKEYAQIKIGDRIKIKTFVDKGRIIKVGDISKDPYFKFESNGRDGFMVGTIWYPYQDCEVVRQ